MSLSNDLVSQFVKITNDKSADTKKETIVYGTTVEYEGSIYVKIDGSDLLTPVMATANTKSGERVTVMIKNHTATVTGNLSSPAARLGDLDKYDDVADVITDLEIVIANKVDTEEFNAEVARIDELRSDTITVKEGLAAAEADIDNLQASSLTVTGKLTAAEADIDNLQATKLDVTIADARYATITELNATNADLNSLESTYADFEVATANRFTSMDAKIDNLVAGEIEAAYANIDFSNIGTAAIQTFFSKSGMIDDLIVGDGTVSGRLVGVTIAGDLIEGNTIVADKLVIQGADGLYYRLNTNGADIGAEQTEYNSLDGSIIRTQSIAATKISVSDLSAFGATIGGFGIAADAIHSGAKTSVDNATAGIYMDKNGQMAIGDTNRFVKYHTDSEGTCKLEVVADSLIFGARKRDVASEINDTIDRVSNAESLISQLSDSIATLVTDGNGTSLMTQTEDGWIFSTADIQISVDRISENLEALNTETGNIENTVSILQQAVDDLGTLTEYVKISTYEGEPCIELGEGDSDFKLLITNTRIMFMEGTGVPAYFTNQSMHIKKAVIEDELQQGGFVWKARSNGNLGLVWKGVTE